MPANAERIETLMGLSGDQLKKELTQAEASGKKSDFDNLIKVLEGKESSLEIYPSHEDFGAAYENATQKQRELICSWILERAKRETKNPTLNLLSMKRIENEGETRGIPVSFTKKGRPEKNEDASQENNKSRTSQGAAPLSQTPKAELNLDSPTPNEMFYHEILNSKGEETGECLVYIVANKGKSDRDTTVLVMAGTFDANGNFDTSSGAMQTRFLTNLAEINASINCRRPKQKKFSLIDYFSNNKKKNLEGRLGSSWDRPCPVTEDLINGTSTLKEYIEGFSSMYGINPMDYEKMRDAKLMETPVLRGLLRDKEVSDALGRIYEAFNVNYGELAEEAKRLRKETMVRRRQEKQEASEAKKQSLFSDPRFSELLLASTGETNPNDNTIQQYLDMICRGDQELREFSKQEYANHIDRLRAEKAKESEWKRDEILQTVQNLYISKGKLSELQERMLEGFESELYSKYSKQQGEIFKELGKLYDAYMERHGGDEYAQMANEVNGLLSLTSDIYQDRTIAEERLKKVEATMEELKRKYPKSNKRIQLVRLRSSLLSIIDTM